MDQGYSLQLSDAASYACTTAAQQSCRGPVKSRYSAAVDSADSKARTGQYAHRSMLVEDSSHTVRIRYSLEDSLSSTDLQSRVRMSYMCSRRTTARPDRRAWGCQVPGDIGERGWRSSQRRGALYLAAMTQLYHICRGGASTIQPSVDFLDQDAVLLVAPSSRPLMSLLACQRC